jgi:peptide/nickel transport system substrate-binding protein
MASFCAGPRVAHFDRVEWLTMPDPATQAAALRRGEFDWVEQPVMDLMPSLRKDANLTVEVGKTTGFIGVLQFNQLFPPFDNPAIRRAAPKAVNQTDFMAAAADAADHSVINAHVGFFAPSSPYASNAGARRTWRRRRRWLGISSCRRSRMCHACRLGCTISRWRTRTT